RCSGISYEVKACLFPDVFCLHEVLRSDMEIRGQMGASTGPYKGLWSGLGWITGPDVPRHAEREKAQ
ncbi:hypothetical protein JOQ06_006774, partial [Pogonophryne albipinna]